jgi:hypothetical protein
MSKRKPRSESERWLSMTAEDLSALGEKYSSMPARQPTAAERARHDRVLDGLRRGRPQVGQGSARVVISVERGLLIEVDSVAGSSKVKRSQAVAAGLRLWLRQMKRRKAG